MSGEWGNERELEAAAGLWVEFRGPARTATAARLGFVHACRTLQGMHSMPLQGDESMTTSLHSIGLDADRAGAGGSGAAGQGAGGGHGARVRGVSSVASPPLGLGRPSGC
jgi:hypothetical protein